QLRCRRGGDCLIVKSTRKFCKACRLASCLKNGMKKDLISSVKNEREQRELQLSLSVEVAHLKAYDFERFTQVQRAMRIFKEEDQLPLVSLEGPDTATILNINQYYVNGTIRYCKHFDCFTDLSQDNQMILVKWFHQEMGALRAAYNYQPQEDGIHVLA
ncbi:PREDICTED: nuclear receptor subfamily 1 group I member 3-like, partial [Rhagoletis zephyria]|uniref:nuclear receptor subfamily 1 group I member 3-like n=1 Tax=Rhagoletis zephyria TaxID=28612 RepID=UPI0008115CE0